MSEQFPNTSDELKAAADVMAYVRDNFIGQITANNKFLPGVALGYIALNCILTIAANYSEEFANKVITDIGSFVKSPLNESGLDLNVLHDPSKLN